MADKFIDRAFSYFSGLKNPDGTPKYSKNAAAALAANATHESGGGTTIYEKDPKGHPPGFGMMQWDPNRKAGLYQWAANNGKDPESEEAQLAYIDHELDTTEKASGDRLRAAQTYQDATNAVLGYLRPQGYTDKDPGSSLGYTDRHNLGASYAGVDPINVPPIGASQSVGPGASSNPAMQAAAPALPPPPTMTAGQGNADIMAGLLAQQKEAKQQQGYAEATKAGLGLLGQADTTPQQVQAPPAQIHRPQAGQPQLGNPDFLQMLAQQRLMRGV